MAQQKVLIMETGSLLSAGTYNLLAGLSHLDVRRSEFTGLDELKGVIETFQPQVLVVDDAGLSQRTLALLPTLAKYSKLRTVIVHWQENQIEICDRHRVVINEVSDFLDLFG
jgi:hypothetical protein